MGPFYRPHLTSDQPLSPRAARFQFRASSCLPITGFLALALCSGLSANLKERIYPGIDPPTRIASFRSLALSVSDSGVLVISRNPAGGNDLTYHFGEDFAQVVTILTSRQALVLSGKGFVQGDMTFFALILDNKPYLLSIDEVTRSFDLEEVDSEEKYFNSDLLVTDEGEIWILVYDTVLFQPRLAPTAIAIEKDHNSVQFLLDIT